MAQEIFEYGPLVIAILFVAAMVLLTRGPEDAAVADEPTDLELARRVLRLDLSERVRSRSSEVFPHATEGEIQEFEDCLRGWLLALSLARVPEKIIFPSAIIRLFHLALLADASLRDQLSSGLGLDAIFLAPSSLPPTATRVLEDGHDKALYTACVISAASRLLREAGGPDVQEELISLDRRHGLIGSGLVESFFRGE